MMVTGILMHTFFEEIRNEEFTFQIIRKRIRGRSTNGCMGFKKASKPDRVIASTTTQYEMFI
jgi:hypothetical protein